MAARSPFNPTEITPNDARPLEGYEHQGSLYQPARIDFRQPIIITNIQKKQVKDLDFSNSLKHDMLITGISADIVADDGKQIQEDTNSYRFSYVQTIIQTLDKNNGRVLKTMTIFLSSYPNYLNELTLSPTFLYKVSCNMDVNSITLLGKPLIQEQPVYF